ncbi:U3 small nucleolar RNA-associated protein 21 [Nannizzia gypsea CBS 118893]|uniref:U3 small nucleolar RNA-associated protein 21 n=1 Tax=Arthroderma gypseum (strain ATCC MYA-4604 / CBS 118893) TaxID=535722 RepID=E4V5Z0_ARTGP|nr:U3 small nucleolar RNA-associated protein 21 [Nannizzia gypsea CBS 118893]EFR05515.1 U3 small nucleolar RNA-associated protein 21 [Nannizzia gypsea CBS 118893]
MADEAFDLPLAKRQKVVTEKPSHSQAPDGSRIFTPFRTLGLVSSTSVPFTSIPLGKTTFQITTSVGHSLQTYDLRRGLSLVFLTRPQTPALITAIHAWKDRVFAAWGGQSVTQQRGVWVFKRGKKVAELEMPAIVPGSAAQSVDRLVVFGSWVVGCCSNCLIIWKSADYSHYTTLIPAATKEFTKLVPDSLCTMPTYLNKVFVGRSDGCVDIWNVSTGKLVYSVLPTLPGAGAVSALQPAPALSLMAIAYASGALVIHNVRTDKPVLCLKKPGMTNSSPITSISFRTDGIGAGEDGRKDGVMATASADGGDIVMWDLNNGGRVTGVVRNAHEPSGEDRGVQINKVEFLPGQPVMVSTGSDNALRTWIFDQTPFSPTPRPLHARSGHSAPITKVMFVPSGSDGSEVVGKWLLSAGQDRSLFGLSLRKDSQSAELSQGNVKSKAKKMGTSSTPAGQQTIRYEVLKAPEITCLACSLNRDGGMGTVAGGPIWTNAKAVSAENTNMTGWESVVTGHKGDKFARTWIWGKKKAGRWALETGDGTEVKSVAMSQCGTFALVGSDGGSLVMYNLQSGIRRQSFPPRLTPAQAKKAKLQRLVDADENELDPRKSTKHTKAITGIVVDSLNTTVISCGLDGKVKFWSLLTGQLLDELDWNPMCAITGLRFSSTSDLLALSCDDLSIRVIDTQTKKLVRELWGCVGQVNDFTISNDGRWIVAASMDSVIRVWDLPTGHLIDAFRLKNTCVALSFSSTGEFLATAHAEGVGINLWNNKSLFIHVPTRHIEEDTSVVAAAPTASGEGGVAMIEAAFDDNGSSDDQKPLVLTPEQLSRDMMTLSMTPKTRWQTLLHLDTIKQRNKPKEAPKKPKKAPFFLPSLESKTIAGAAGPGSTSVDQDENEMKNLQTERSRIARIQRMNGSGEGQSSKFTALLHSAGLADNFTPFIEYLKLLSPANTDLEIRSLDPRGQNHQGNELALFVRALTERLRQKRDFELVNTWMAVFLRVHDDAVEAAVGPQSSDSNGGLFGPNVALQQALSEWKVEQESESKRLADLVSYCRGIVGFLRSAR